MLARPSGAFILSHLQARLQLERDSCRGQDSLPEAAAPDPARPPRAAGQSSGDQATCQVPHTAQAAAGCPPLPSEASTEGGLSTAVDISQDCIRVQVHPKSCGQAAGTDALGCSSPAGVQAGLQAELPPDPAADPSSQGGPEVARGGPSLVRPQAQASGGSGQAQLSTSSLAPEGSQQKHQGTAITGADAAGSRSGSPSSAQHDSGGEPEPSPSASASVRSEAAQPSTLPACQQAPDTQQAELAAQAGSMLPATSSRNGSSNTATRSALPENSRVQAGGSSHDSKRSKIELLKARREEARQQAEVGSRAGVHPHDLLTAGCCRACSLTTVDCCPGGSCALCQHCAPHVVQARQRSQCEAVRRAERIRHMETHVRQQEEAAASAVRQILVANQVSMHCPSCASP